MKEERECIRGAATQVGEAGKALAKERKRAEQAEANAKRSAAQLAEAVEELKVLRALRHNNIIRLYAAYETPSKLYLVTLETNC